MKKIVPILFFLLPVLSCHKVEPASPGKDLAFVSIRAFETKSQIGTNALPAWSEGDRISIVGDLSDAPAEFTLRSGAGYSSASFEGVKPEGNMFMAYYPSSARCDGITWRGLLSTKISHAMPSQYIGTLPLWGRGNTLSWKRTGRFPANILSVSPTASSQSSTVLISSGWTLRRPS